MSKHLEVTPLTPEAFTPYGVVVERGGTGAPGSVSPVVRFWPDLYQWESADGFCVNLLEARVRPFVLDRLERHKASPELVMPIGPGTAILPVAPSGDLEEALDQVRAFLLTGNQGVVLAPGVWHRPPYPLGVDASYAIIFGQTTRATDLEIVDLTGREAIFRLPTGC